MDRPSDAARLGRDTAVVPSHGSRVLLHLSVDELSRVAAQVVPIVDERRLLGRLLGPLRDG